MRAAREQMNMGGLTYPTLPMQEAAPRPQSLGYGQLSAACSPTGSFAGGVLPPPPQPHSSYFSGMTGPQHPFYNRVRRRNGPRGWGGGLSPRISCHIESIYLTVQISRVHLD